MFGMVYLRTFCHDMGQYLMLTRQYSNNNNIINTINTTATATATAAAIEATITASIISTAVTAAAETTTTCKH
jgi:hypothetical protein